MKNNVSVKPIKLFRFNSIFVTILVLMLLLCLLMCIVYTGFFTKDILSRTTDHYAQLNQAHLDTVAANTDFLLDNLHQSMTQLSFSQNMLAITVMNETNAAYFGSSVLELARVTVNNPLLESAFVYFTNIGKVITSSYNSFDLKYFPKANLVDYYERNWPTLLTIESSGNISSLLSYQGELVLVRDFPLYGDSRLATIYYIVDMEMLFENITAELPDNTNIWVYSAKGEPILGASRAYPKNIDAAFLSKLEASEDEYIETEEGCAFLRVSEMTGWKYLYLVDESSLTPKVGSLLKTIAPVVLIIMVLAAVVAGLMASFIYRPFQKLLNEMESRDIFPTELPAYKNEFTYLNYTLSELVEKQNELDSMIGDASQDMLSRMFSNLMTGVQMSNASIQKILATTKSRFTIRAPYMVCVVAVDPAENGQPADKGSYVAECVAGLNGIAKKSGTLVRVLDEDDDKFSVVISFSSDLGIVQMRGIVTDFENIVHSSAYGKGIKEKFGKGHVYQHIHDISISYQEALEMLETPEPEIIMESADEAVTQQKVLKTIDYKERAKQAVELVLEGRPCGATTLIERVLEDVVHANSGLDVQKANCKAVITAFMDRMFTHKCFNSRNLPKDLIEFDTTAENAEELISISKTFCEKITTEFSKSIKKQQNHFIISAQKYIAENYGDCNLSLSMIAEAIGSTSNYLSKLFISNLGVYYTAYLNSYRIDRSMEILSETDMSVKDVALKTGFTSVQNYIRVFKKQTGMTPGAYRAVNGKATNEE